jgi:hypothetical protein
LNGLIILEKVILFLVKQICYIIEVKTLIFCDTKTIVFSRKIAQKISQKSSNAKFSMQVSSPHYVSIFQQCSLAGTSNVI